MPIFSAMAATRSTSKPSATVPFMDSNGGNAVSEPTVITPSVTRVMSSVGMLVSVPAVVSRLVPVVASVASVVVVSPSSPPQPTSAAAPSTSMAITNTDNHGLAFRIGPSFAQLPATGRRRLQPDDTGLLYPKGSAD